MLLKINDPLAIKQKLKNEDDIAIGIDFGTSNSVISYYDGYKVQIIPDEFGNLIPSVVSYGSSVLVGKKALKTDNQIIIKSIKRLLGRKLTELDLQKIPFEILEDSKSHNLQITVAKHKQVLPEEIVADILKYLKAVAEKHLAKEIKKAVITVPAYFDETQRIAVKNAAALAKLQVLRLINEPTSAALAYGLDQALEGTYVIYDLGGGTFDVSILSLKKGIFTVKATAGDTLLGGDDIDYLIYQDVFADYLKSYSCNQLDKVFLLSQAKLIKEELSTKGSISKKIKIKRSIISVNFSVEKLQVHLQILCAKTLNICKNALKDADILKSEITGVVLVGGSTKIPYIQTSVASFFQSQPLSSINPDEVVSIGAGHKAAELTGKITGSLLLDVIPLSLGIEIAGGLVEKIIPRNSIIPIAKQQDFTTFKDNQTAFNIHVVQGERELVSDVRSLGRFTLKIPPATAGTIKIEVTFSVDADGLLIVDCVEKNSKIKQSLEIKPSWGLEVSQMRTMIEDSIENAQADVLKRLLIQSKIEAERVIDALQVALSEDSNLLNKTMAKTIHLALENLQNSLNTTNSAEIDNNLKILEEKSHKFAELRMEKNIQKALQGHSLKEFS